MEGFQVDVILNSLKELQKEKSQNERILAEKYANRKQTEAQLEATSTKLITISDKHNKMKETLQIAELKVAQTQAQAKMFEQLNCERRDRITELNSQIEQKSQERQSYMEVYESQMTLLTEKFRMSWQTQNDDAMDLKQVQYKQEMKEYPAKIEANKLQLDEISRQLDKETGLIQTRSKSIAAFGGVPEETWTLTIAMFVGERQASKEALKVKLRKEQEHIDQLRTEQAKHTEVLEKLQEQYNKE